MEARAICLTLAACLGLLAWFYVDYRQSLQIDYGWHSFLVNKTTGVKMDPWNAYDLSNVIRPTEEYVNSTNAMERLYNLEYNLNIENTFPTDQIYSNPEQLAQSGWPVSNQSKCGDDLSWILDQLAAHPNYPFIKGKVGLEITQFMDSFGRPEAGLYSGLITWMGSHKGCKKASLDGGAIRARYCMARLRPKTWSEDESFSIKTRIRMGICLPEACDTSSFERQQQAIDRLVKFDLNEFYRENFQLDSMFCLPDERSPLRQLSLGARVFLYCIAGWLTLVVGATVACEVSRRKSRRRTGGRAGNNIPAEIVMESKQDVLKSVMIGKGLMSKNYDLSQQTEASTATNSLSVTQKKRTLLNDVIEALSVQNALIRFKSQTPFGHGGDVDIDIDAPVRVDLNCLSSIKFLMAILVLAGHAAFLTSCFGRTLNNKVELWTGEVAKGALSLSKCVDTFFFLFGMLASYTLLKRFNVDRLSSPMIWLMTNIRSLMRIAPVFMLVYWYSKLISRYTGEGPWWDYGVYRYSFRGICQNEPWYTSIPQFGRPGLQPASACVPQGWFLVCYTQLTLILPLMIYILYKMPNNAARYLMIMFAIAISSIQFAMKVYQQRSIRKEVFTMYGGFMLSILERFQSIGTISTLSRVGFIMISCHFGYLIRMYELGEIRQWPKWVRSRLTLAIVIILHCVVLLMPLIGHYLTLDGKHLVSLSEFIGSYLVMMNVWPILNGLLVINAVTVYNRSSVVRFLSNPRWHPANQLGYCVYLLHWEILLFATIGSEFGPSAGLLISDMVKMACYVAVCTISLSFIVHIFYEAPMYSLLMLATKPAKNRMMTQNYLKG